MVDEAQVVADAVAGARDWVNTPPGDLTPAGVRRRGRRGRQGGLQGPRRPQGRRHGDRREAARRAGLRRHPRRRQRLGRPSAAGRADLLPRQARSPTSRWSARASPSTPAASPSSRRPSMNEMKSDMAGAAAVVQATCAIARLKLPVKVSTFVPMAENMVSGSAVRPGDVLTMYGGTTVEVLNTDAEGRLVLGDALVRATEVKPDVILDVATLTGHMVVALGDKVAGVMGSDDVVERGARRVRDRRRGALAHADPRGDGRPHPHQQDRRPVPARLDPLGRRPVRGGVPARVHRRPARGRTSTSPARPGTPADRPVTITFGGTGWAVATLVDYARATAGDRRRARRLVSALRASCVGCSPASAAGCRPPRRRRTGSGACCRTCAPTRPRGPGGGSTPRRGAPAAGSRR